MHVLFTTDEILAATGGRLVGSVGPVTGVSIDSREVGQGNLFVAIRGDRFDGHDFVVGALDAGATAALISEERAAGLPQDRLIVVPDALQGLRDLARAARARSRAQVVAVTGSAGKTTTKEAIRVVCEAAGQTHASIKSFNNHWGVPLTLARLPRKAEFGVFELGMNHAGEIAPLAQLVRPHVAVVTTVAAAHLEFFDSVAAIARAKAEIFTGLEPGGTALLNADHQHVEILSEAAEAVGARVVRYGFAEEADWRIGEVRQSGESQIVEVGHRGESIRLHLAVSGRHMVANAVAALATADLFGISREIAVTALARFSAPEGRGQAIRLGPPEKPLLLLDESYNANAASMAAALDVFGNVVPPAGRKVLVLGDMLELGREGPALHAALKDRVIASGADDIYLVGTAIGALAQALGPRVSAHATAVDEVADRLVDALAYGDAVMIKGSNGVRLGGLVKRLRERFG